MHSKDLLLMTAFWVMVALFVYGGAHLFQLRFESGDVYPEYSSFRSDPLGTRVLYQSLERIAGLAVSRNIAPLSRLPLSEKRTLILAGIKHQYGLLDSWSWLPSIEHQLGSGSRVVVCSFPQEGYASLLSEQEAKKAATPGKSDDNEPRRPEDKSSEEAKETKSPQEEIQLRLRRATLARRWGFEFDSEKAASPQQEGQHSNVSLQQSVDLPQSLSWHSGLAFKNVSSDWRIIYRRQGKPVLMERPMGSGTLVLASDSYFLSNEALWKDRQPRLLAWLVGPHRAIVFDETHLGVEEAPGVMSLMRRYRLHGLLASLLLLAGLFVWKNVLSLVPLPSAAEAEKISAGLDSAAGFTNLLQRSVPTPRLLEVCVQQWAKSLPAGGPERAWLNQVQPLLAEEQLKPPKARDPVRCYWAICRMIQRKPKFIAEEPKLK